MEFLNVTNEIIILLTGLIGLIGTGIGTYFAIKTKFEALKAKTKAEQWTLLMEMADAAMTKAEKSEAAGQDKKATVIAAVNAAACAANIDLQDFMDQLSSYIDQTIDFVNEMKKRT